MRMRRGFLTSYGAQRVGGRDKKVGEVNVKSKTVKKTKQVEGNEKK